MADENGVTHGITLALIPTWLEHGRMPATIRARGATDAAEFVGGSCHLAEADESDHGGVCCAIRLPSEPELGKESAIRGAAFPLRRGLRGRVGSKGVARRPTKFAACAKVEPRTAHDAGGPSHYCSKCFEKPRIPGGDAALIEDDRRRDPWRLC